MGLQSGMNLFCEHQKKDNQNRINPEIFLVSTQE